MKSTRTYCDICKKLNDHKEGFTSGAIELNCCGPLDEEFRTSWIDLCLTCKNSILKHIKSLYKDKPND